MPLKAKYRFDIRDGNEGELDLPATGGSQDISLDGQKMGHVLYPGDRESTNGAETIIRLGSAPANEVYLSKKGDALEFEMFVPKGNDENVDELISFKVELKRV